MDVEIKGIVFKDIDEIAKSTFFDPDRGIHTIVCACLDTGELYVHEKTNFQFIRIWL